MNTYANFEKLVYRLRTEQVRHISQSTNLTTSPLFRGLETKELMFFYKFMQFLCASDKYETAITAGDIFYLMAKPYSVELLGAAFTASKTAPAQYTELLNRALTHAKVAWYQMQDHEGCALPDDERGLYVAYCLSQIFYSMFSQLCKDEQKVEGFGNAVLSAVPASKTQQNAIWEAIIEKSVTKNREELRAYVQYFIFELDRYYMTMYREPDILADIDKDNAELLKKGMSNIGDTLTVAHATFWCAPWYHDEDSASATIAFATQLAQFIQDDGPNVQGMEPRLDISQWASNKSALRALYELSAPLRVPPAHERFYHEKPLRLCDGIYLRTMDIEIARLTSRQVINQAQIYLENAQVTLSANILFKDLSDDEKTAFLKNQASFENEVMQAFVKAISSK